jgi:cysteine-rich repeat protein
MLQRGCLPAVALVCGLHLLVGRAAAIEPLLTILNPAARPTYFGEMFVAASNEYVAAAAVSEYEDSSRGAVYVFDIETGALLRRFGSPLDERYVFGLTVALAGTRLCVGATFAGDDWEEGEPFDLVFVYDVPSGALLHTLQTSPPISASGDRLASWGGEAAIRIYDLADGALERTIVLDLPWSLDLELRGDRLLAGEHGGAGLFDVASGARVLSLPSSSGSAFIDVALGDAYAVGLEERFVGHELAPSFLQVFDAATGALIRTDSGDRSNLGRRIVMAGHGLLALTRDGSVMLSDVRSGRLLGAWVPPNVSHPHHGEVAFGPVAASDTRIAVGESNSVARAEDDPLSNGAVYVYAKPVCGNGVIEGTEECDPGSDLAGDCCSAECAFSAGEICGSTSDLCSQGTCDESGTCRVDQWASCTPVDRAQIRLERGVLRATLGTHLEGMPIGDPTADTDYALCLFDETGHTLVASLSAPAGPRWRARDSRRKRAFKYRSSAEASEPRRFVVRQARDTARFLVSGRDVDVPAPGEERLLSVQVRNREGSCWVARDARVPR